MEIIVSGSLAYDRIMDFSGRFADHILPEKIHILNVSFLVNGVDEKFGGTAGNIAYNLALLQEAPRIVSAVGRDFALYAERLDTLGLPLTSIIQIETELTAGAYITTDGANNQITGFNPGAMKYAAGKRLDVEALDKSATVAIIAPGNVEDMVSLAERYRAANVPYIFDPGQQITAMTGDQLLSALTGASLLVSNDYELEMIAQATSQTQAELLARTGAVITTLGENGSVVTEPGGETRIPAIPQKNPKDPTGAGDAYRAGLIKGLVTGKCLAEAAAMGSTCAAYCVAEHGTQEHSFDLASFTERFTRHYGELVQGRAPGNAICLSA